MKIVAIRTKIIIHSSISLTLLSIFAGIFTYNFYQSKNALEAINKIKSETSQIQARTSELRAKSIEIKKYTTLWKEIPDNKKSTSGIKMNDVNSALSETADRYSISEQAIKVNLPEAIETGIFAGRKTITTTVTTASLTFNSVDDTRAFMFISDFFNRIPGYKVTTSMSVTKTKDYTSADFVDISLNKPGVAAVRSKIDFVWYTFKEKENGK